MVRQETSYAAPDVRATRRLPHAAVWLGAAAVAVPLLMVAFFLGYGRGQSNASVQEETLTCYSRIPISCQMDDGRWVGVPTDFVQWVDSDGVHHHRGRPECLPPTGQQPPVTLGIVFVEDESRHVVWVKC